ncbi:unnamed protein product, partial [Ectocarpus sp. 8 AP-2014]
MIPYICFSSMLLRPEILASGRVVSELSGKVWPCVIKILSPPFQSLGKARIVVFARNMVFLSLILSGYWYSMFLSPSYSVFRPYHRIRPDSINHQPFCARMNRVEHLETPSLRVVRPSTKSFLLNYNAGPIMSLAQCRWQPYSPYRSERPPKRRCLR